MHLLSIKYLYLDGQITVDVCFALHKDLILSVEVIYVVTVVQVLLFLPRLAQVLYLLNAIVLHAGSCFWKLLAKIEEFITLKRIDLYQSLVNTPFSLLQKAIPFLADLGLALPHLE